MNIRKWLRNDSLIAPADGTGINLYPIKFFEKDSAAYLAGANSAVYIAKAGG